MKRITGTAVCIAVAGALSVVLALPAQAAQGTFTYTGKDGKHHSISNPQNDKCYVIPPAYSPASGFVSNATNTDAEMYDSNAGCKGSSTEDLAPGDEDPDATFVAVKFIG